MKKWLTVLFVFPLFLFSESEIVIGVIKGQLGNNLFNIAAACALAWDHNAIPYFPNLLNPQVPERPENIAVNYAHILFRCNLLVPEAYNHRPFHYWREPSFLYHPISYRPNIIVDGFFQSEKYFAHHRARLLELFAPLPEDLRYVEQKYQWIIEHPCSVGIQIRDYWGNDSYPHYGKDLMRKGAAFFPSDALFVITSNNIDFVRENIPEEIKNFVLIENEPHYIDFILLQLCKHNICSNSTFGWWAAWLNKNPDKKVVVPKKWCHYVDATDLIPRGWIQIDPEYQSKNR